MNVGAGIAQSVWPAAYGLDDGPWVQTRDFSHLQSIETSWGPTILLYSEHGGVVSAGAMQQKCEAEVKNDGAVPPFAHMSSRHDA
jgi:hypothetical protein